MQIFSFGISEMSQALLPQRGHLSGFDFLSIYAPFFITVSFTANTKGKKIYSGTPPYTFRTAFLRVLQ